MIAERLTAQLLAGAPARDPLAVAERLLAVQGQDPRGVRLAIRSRTRGLSAGDVDRALSVERTLVISWLNRGTLHLVRSEDYFWLQTLTGPRQLTGSTRRLAQAHVAPAAAERAMDAVERSLGEQGPLTRRQLGEQIERAGVRTDGQALIHLLGLAAFRGLIVRGPLVGGEHAYVLVRDWLGEPPALDRDAALAELARRYLRGHGPADARDLAKWSGLTLRDARFGLQAIAPELSERRDGLLDLAGRPAPAPAPSARLLGAFDPLLLGWCSREPILGDNVSVVTVNGIFRPIALVRGRAAATWSLPGGDLVLEAFVQLSRAELSALAVEAQDVARYLATG